MMTLSQAARALGVDAHTVKAWVKRENEIRKKDGRELMRLEADPLDHRPLMIADEDVEQLRQIHARDRRDLEARVAALEATIEQLRRRASWLFAENASVRVSEGNLAALANELPGIPATPVSAPVAAVARTGRHPQRRSSEVGDAPPEVVAEVDRLLAEGIRKMPAEIWQQLRRPPLGAVAFSTWCMAHNINPRAAAQEIAEFKMPTPTHGAWLPRSGGVPLTHIYTVEQQEAAATFARGRWPDRWDKPRAGGDDHS